MASEAPPFWWQPPGWQALALLPFSAIYGAAAGQRLRKARREPVAAPVLCVGNFTVGGTGKTPLAIALARQAARMAHRPGFVSRGHGGGVGHGVHLVDAAVDTARHVGDEPLLLAEAAPTAVSADRAAAARLLIDRGCDFLIMDDGFQSSRILIDYALVVIDARFGVGNGHVIPGGPLRAPLAEQLRFADAIVRGGEGNAADMVVRQAARAGKPVFDVRTRPKGAGRLAGRRFLAFAGIGHPERFFDSIAAAGGTVAQQRRFGDHHVYAADELQDLLDTARRAQLDLITTAKDAARLRHAVVPDGFQPALDVLDVETVFEPRAAAARVIEETLLAARTRLGR